VNWLEVGLTVEAEVAEALVEVLWGSFGRFRPPPASRWKMRIG